MGNLPSSKAWSGEISLCDFEDSLRVSSIEAGIMENNFSFSWNASKSDNPLAVGDPIVPLSRTSFHENSEFFKGSVLSAVVRSKSGG